MRNDATYKASMGFPEGSVVKKPPAKQKTRVPSLGWKDPLEKPTQEISQSMWLQMSQTRLSNWTPTMRRAGRCWNKNKSSCSEIYSQKNIFQKWAKYRPLQICKTDIIHCQQRYTVTCAKGSLSDWREMMPEAK